MNPTSFFFWCVSESFTCRRTPSKLLYSPPPRRRPHPWTATWGSAPELRKRWGSREKFLSKVHPQKPKEDCHLIWNKGLKKCSFNVFLAENCTTATSLCLHPVNCVTMNIFNPKEDLQGWMRVPYMFLRKTSTTFACAKIRSVEEIFFFLL